MQLLEERGQKTPSQPKVNWSFGRKTDNKVNRFNNYCEETQLTRSDVALLSRLWLGAGLKDPEDPPRRSGWWPLRAGMSPVGWVRQARKFTKAFRDPEGGWVPPETWCPRRLSWLILVPASAQPVWRTERTKWYLQEVGQGTTHRYLQRPGPFSFVGQGKVLDSVPAGQGRLQRSKLSCF